MEFDTIRYDEAHSFIKGSWHNWHPCGNISCWFEENLHVPDFEEREARPVFFIGFDTDIYLFYSFYSFLSHLSQTSGL